MELNLLGCATPRRPQAGHARRSRTRTARRQSQREEGHCGWDTPIVRPEEHWSLAKIGERETKAEGGSVAQFVVKDEGLFNHIEWHKSIMLMREVDRRRTFFCIDGGWTMLHVRRSIPTCRRRRRRMRCSVASVIALSCLVVSSNVVSCSVSPAGTSATRRIYASTYEGAFVISMIRHGRRAEERQADPMEHVDLITQHPINSAYDALMDTDAESVRKASRLNEGYGDSTALMDTDAESVRKASLLNEGYEDSTAIVNGDSPNLVSIDPDWGKRHARSIDEGVRFKSQLREGLEKESKMHRERMLSKVMDGVISGTKSSFENFRPQPQTNSSQTNILSRLNPAKWGKLSRNATDGEEIRDSPEISEPVPVSEESEVENTQAKESESRQIGARTIYGLLSALAEEVEGLDVEVDADPNTPFWRKHVMTLSIFFTRLGFRQMRFGGLDEVFSELEESLTPSEKFALARNFFRVGKPTSADEAFDRIDVDGSGALDEEELAQALKMAAVLGGNKFGIRSKKTISELASRLVRLYDTDGDGVVDREEYQVMVKDMAALRDARKSDEIGIDAVESDGEGNGWFPPLFRGKDGSTSTNNTTIEGDNIFDVSDDEHFLSSLDRGEGSIVFEDLLVDLRQFVFGSIPGVKRILPGGPLILQPFTCTITASWDRDDIMNSFLIDSGLRRLVARALSRRVRGLRDLLDGAVFYGRTWKLFEQNAPLVEVPKLDNIEFDNRNRLIITGRARIKDALGVSHKTVEQGFKLRTKIGTRNDGRIIGLLRPEIAIFAQCPEDVEKRVRAVFKDWFSYTIPTFQPLYSYIPLVSPLKKDDKMVR